MKRMSFLPMGAVVLLLAFTACSEELTEVPSSTLKQIVMTATDFETIYVSAGVRGLQIEIAPKALIAFTGSIVADVATKP